MKQKLLFVCFLILALLLISHGGALAQASGSCGEDGSNVTWYLDDYGIYGTLTISGTGAMADGNHWSKYESKIYRVIIKNGVTSIGSDAFKNFKNLLDVTIPDSVTRIGSSAFAYCEKLDNVTIPNGVTTIENSTFCCCYGLNHIVIPDSVTRIGRSAFAKCRHLDDDIISDSVTYIGEYAFIGCASFTTVTIPKGVTHIEAGTFELCESLTSVIIHNSVTTIGEDAFDDCPGLRSVLIPKSVTRIERNAFGYEELTSAIILNSECYLRYAFHPYTTLYGYRGSTAEEAYRFVALDSAFTPDLILPTGLTSIAEDAFLNIAAVSVQIPASVTSISGNPFAGSSVQIILGIPGTIAETFAESSGYLFISVTN